MRLVDVWAQIPTEPAAYRARLDELGLDDEATASFLSGNARRVFWMPAIVA